MKYVYLKYFDFKMLSKHSYLNENIKRNSSETIIVQQRL